MSTTVGDLVEKLKVAWEADPDLGAVPVYRDQEPPHDSRAFPYIVVKIKIGGALRRVTNFSWFRQPTLEFTVRDVTPEAVEAWLGKMRAWLDKTRPELDAGKGHVLNARCVAEAHGQDEPGVCYGRLDCEYWRREPRTRA